MSTETLTEAALRWIELMHQGHNRSCLVPSCYPCEILEKAGRRKQRCKWPHEGACLVRDQIEGGKQ